MFDTLTEKFEQTVKRLRGHGKITESNVDEAVREVRLALLEADVHFQVVRDFTERVRQRALGQDVLASLTPEQHFVKIVRTELTSLMGENAAELSLSASPPVVIMLVGLHGSGKTTTVAKLAHYLRTQRKRSPYLVPADVYRPAAIEQLTTLGHQLDMPVHPTAADADPVRVCRDAYTEARNHGYDVVLLDTAGRLHIDDELMGELERIVKTVEPFQTILVVDAMTGQDAVNVASEFHRRLSLNGVIMTKLDGDARGGAALSVRAVTGAPLLFIGTGEKVDALEVFHPGRMATRILGMGDVLTLIEKAEQVYDQKQALKLQQKLRKNEFTLDDFAEQLKAVHRMGAIGDLLNLVPGMRKLTRGMDTAEAEDELKHIEAIISSMTKAERRNHAILNGSRRRRVADGSGTSVEEVNQFLKQFVQTKKVMKHMTKLAGKGLPPGFPG
jgi:signal recognition particle subunit SRP54